MKITEIEDEKKLEFNMRENILDLSQKFTEIKRNILSKSWEINVKRIQKIDNVLVEFLSKLNKAIIILSDLSNDKEAQLFVDKYKNLIPQVEYARKAIQHKDFTWAEIVV
jgi:hypothetical protein